MKLEYDDMIKKRKCLLKEISGLNEEILIKYIEENDKTIHRGLCEVSLSEIFMNFGVLELHIKNSEVGNNSRKSIESLLSIVLSYFTALGARLGVLLFAEDVNKGDNHRILERQRKLFEKIEEEKSIVLEFIFDLITHYKKYGGKRRQSRPTDECINELSSIIANLDSNMAMKCHLETDMATMCHLNTDNIVIWERIRGLIKGIAWIIDYCRDELEKEE